MSREGIEKGVEMDAQEKAIQAVAIALWRIPIWVSGDFEVAWQELSEQLRSMYLANARRQIRNLGLVAVDPKLVEEAREESTRNKAREEMARETGKFGYARDSEAHYNLAAAVLFALDPKRWER